MKPFARSTMARTTTGLAVAAVLFAGCTSEEPSASPTEEVSPTAEATDQPTTAPDDGDDGASEEPVTEERFVGELPPDFPVEAVPMIDAPIAYSAYAASALFEGVSFEVNLHVTPEELEARWAEATALLADAGYTEDANDFSGSVEEGFSAFAQFTGTDLVVYLTVIQVPSAASAEFYLVPEGDYVFAYVTSPVT